MHVRNITEDFRGKKLRSTENSKQNNPCIFCAKDNEQKSQCGISNIFVICGTLQHLCNICTGTGDEKYAHGIMANCFVSSS